MTLSGHTARARVIHPHAKINLLLRVGLVQPDGYHDVRTVLQSIALADTLTATPRRGPLRLTVDTPGVPADRTNLVWRSAAALWRAMGKTGEPNGVALALGKKIPAAAGLGGGSSDAAATLVVLNQVWGAGMSQPDLAAIAATLGADVPFFLHGGTALGVGRGDEIYPLEELRPLGVVLLMPQFGVPTADAYRWLDDDRTGTRVARDVAPDPIDLGWRGRPVSLVNDLQGPVARRFPLISTMIDALLDAGALAAAMSGSGSAVFGLFALPVVRRAAARLRRPEWNVLTTRTLLRRAPPGR